jgi:hypothetical protein
MRFNTMCRVRGQIWATGGEARIYFVDKWANFFKEAQTDCVDIGGVGDRFFLARRYDRGLLSSAAGRPLI